MLAFISVFSSHLPLQKLPYWHHEARMVGKGELLKETRGERQFHDDLGAESDRNEAWRSMSEVFSLAVLWLDSRTYQCKLGDFSLVENAIGTNFCQKEGLNGGVHMSVVG